MKHHDKPGSPGDILAHKGVKGMRKGHGKSKRIDRTNGRDPKRLAILYGRRRGKREPFAVQNQMAEHVNTKVLGVNAKYLKDDFSKVEWGKPNSLSERAKKYTDEILDLTVEGSRAAVKDVYGVFPNKGRKAELNDLGDRIVVREDEIKHADENAVAIFDVERNSRGLIESISPVPEEGDQVKHHEKPGTPGDILHYGVKGMRWGHRKPEDSGGGGGGAAKEKPEEKVSKNSSTKSFMAASASLDQEAKTLSPAQVDKNLGTAQQKFHAKFESTPPKSSGQSGSQKEPHGIRAKWNNLTPAQKSAIIRTGVYVGVAGAVVYAGHRNKKAILAMAGRPISVEQFNKNTAASQMTVWGGGNYCKKEAFARQAFELPAGHEFFRLSMAEETAFNKATYATASVEDLNRYIANFRHEKGGADLNFIRFKSTEPTKVPDLRTVLDTLKETMSANSGHPAPSDKSVIQTYNSLSGGRWDGPEAKSLIEGLKRKGYGALVDEMDAGVIGDKPLVFFNSEHATPKQSVALTKQMIDAAESNLIELSNRKF